ncbi:MAG: hypothetical protein M3Y08_19315, partial [Fibrobacterota bacterium]|nr:hypothetical protein [Fibrobacterota bacterium]
VLIQPSSPELLPPPFQVIVTAKAELYVTINTNTNKNNLDFTTMARQSFPNGSADRCMRDNLSNPVQVTAISTFGIEIGKTP